jgi:hypothetical protein
MMTKVVWFVMPIMEDRLSELADYRKIHGHCNVPHRYSKTSPWALGHKPRTITGSPR